MNNLRTTFALSLLITFSVACSGKSIQDPTSKETHEIPEEISIQSVAETIAFKDAQTTKIFNAYLRLKDALVATDGEKANEEAKKLGALLAEGKYKTIKVEVHKIAETKDPKTQRESFNILSDQLIDLAKNSELASGNLFLQHCPMANGNKGANWLSLSEEIRNPYFGDKMLKCGSLIEKI